MVQQCRIQLKGRKKIDVPCTEKVVEIKWYNVELCGNRLVLFAWVVVTGVNHGCAL